MKVGLNLFLTGRCNLACDYCYQRLGHRAGTLEWESVCAAVEAAIVLQPSRLDVVFNGGEPLLEADLLCRSVSHIVSVLPDEVDLRLMVFTNGTLLDRRLDGFLESHDAAIQLGWHNDPLAKERSPRCHSTIARLLKERPLYAARRVSVAGVVTADRIPGLARRVEELIGIGIGDIRLAPSFMPDPAWTSAAEDELRSELDQIVTSSIRNRQLRGSIPVAFLRSDGMGAWTRPSDPRRLLCQGGSDRAISVDPEGHAWACHRFAPALNQLTPLAADARHLMDLGDVRSRDFTRRLSRWPTGLENHSAFTRRGSKYSSFSRCIDCPWYDDCKICPASVCLCGKDPDRVPDHYCGFQRAVFNARSEFATRSGEADLVSGFRRLEHNLGRLKQALLRESDSTTRAAVSRTSTGSEQR